MPQDSFTLMYVADELKKKLVGGKISRIVQPTRDSLTFIIYTRSGNVKLEACLSAQCCRLSLSDGETNAPAVAPNFCMLLRKHLQNAEILDIVQPDFERIIYFDLKCVSDFSQTIMRLYFEIMGKYSNAVLCENGVIVGALKTTSIGENTRRVLLGGVKYAPPEPQDKFDARDRESIAAALENFSGDRAKFISENVRGISYATALEMVAAYGENISAEQIEQFIFSDPAVPCVTYENGAVSDFKVRSSKSEKINFGSVLEAQTEYYRLTLEIKNFNEKKNKLLSALNGGLKKAEKKLALMREKLLSCRDMEQVKLKGELLCANIYAVKRGDASLTAVNYYDENQPEIKIELDRSLSPSQNMQKYFKRYAKLKRTKLSVEGQLVEAEAQKDYLDGIRAHICAAESLADLEETEDELASLQLVKRGEQVKKKRALPPYRQYACDGYKIMAGRNNAQNDRLTKALSPEDMWLHTQKYHSSHVAIFTDGKPVPDGVIKVAAEICAYYSDGRDGDKIPVDYTLKKFVKKPPASNLGFVIYTDYKTALASPKKHEELLVKDK